MITAFPLVAIPTFAVPVSILLHFASLQILGQTVRQNRSVEAQRDCALAWV